MLLETNYSSNQMSFENRPEPNETVRMNVRTGKVTTTYVPPNVRDVVSDGNQLWWLPKPVDPGPHEFETQYSTPFLLDGRPVAIVSTTLTGYDRLREFREGKWHDTDKIVILPEEFDYSGWAANSIQCQQDQVHLLIHDRDNIFYRSGLDTRTKEQVSENWLQFQNRSSVDRLRETGWTHVDFESWDASKPQNPLGFYRTFGYWFENSQPCGMEWFQDDKNNFSIRWCRFEIDRATDCHSSRLPFRWPPRYRNDFEMRGWFRSTTTAEGDVYVISHDGRDGRLHVLHKGVDNLTLVAQRGSPMIFMICLDCLVLLAIGHAFPMLLLGATSSVLKQKQGRCVYAFGRTEFIFASIFRRSVARMIDISFPLLVCGLSVVLHPDVVGWWQHALPSYFDRFEWNLGSVLRQAQGFQQVLKRFAAVPVLWSILIPGIALFLAQILLQAFTGQTAGKWLSGIKVIRTNVRRCGVARSLLREILLVVDSMLLLSWVPGVISILSTRHSQRIGDLLADTIVVRVPTHNSNSDRPTTDSLRNMNFPYPTSAD